MLQGVAIKGNGTDVRTRVDALTDDKDDNIVLTELKGSETAPLTKNQKPALPDVAQNGGVVVRRGKPGFQGGTEIPPKRVEVVRPSDLKKPDGVDD